MLCIGRKKGQTITLTTQHGQIIKVTVNELSRGYVRLGIEAPRDIAVSRNSQEVKQ